MIIKFSKSKDGIGIPYPPSDRGNGYVNHGYFDLKRQPELIEGVPELQDVPDLMSLVRELNHPRSIVRSLSCEKGPSPAYGTPGITHKLTSFVRIAFEIVDWNTERNYQHLFDSFETFLGTAVRTLSDLIVVDFEIDPANFKDHNNKRCWTMTIWNSGFGRSEAEAKSFWIVGVQLVEEFFAEQRMRFAAELDKGLITIS